MHNHLDRNLIGYGADTPDPQWPGEARIAVSFVLNYEEGGENTILNGDAGSEVFLTETPGGTPIHGRPRPLDRIDVRVRQPRRLLAHPAAVRRAQHALHLVGGRPGAGAQPRRRQGDGRGRPRGGEPRLALDQLQGLHARAGARPHEEDGEGHQATPPASRRSAGTPAASACTRCRPSSSMAASSIRAIPTTTTCPTGCSVDGTPHLIIPYTLEVNDMKFARGARLHRGRRLAAGDEGQLSTCSTPRARAARR